MIKVILLAVFMGFVFMELKGLFKSNTLDLTEEAQKAKQSLESYKGVLVATSVLFALMGIIFDIWAVVFLNIPILFIGAAICILLNIRGLFKMLKMIEEGRIVNKFSVRRFYHLAFDATVLYHLVKIVFQ